MLPMLPIMLLLPLFTQLVPPQGDILREASSLSPTQLLGQPPFHHARQWKCSSGKPPFCGLCLKLD